MRILRSIVEFPVVFVLVVFCGLCVGACGGVTAAPDAEGVVELSEEHASRFPHHRLLVEHVYALSADIRRGLEAGHAVDQVIADYLATLPPEHRNLGRVVRRIEDGLSDEDRRVFDAHVRPFVARAQGALVSVLDDARAVEPTAARRGAVLLLDWLEVR